MLLMLLSATVIVALTSPYVVRPLTRMTLRCRDFSAVYETGRMTTLVLKECRWRQVGVWGH
jgi:hypothetical protein